MRYTRSSAGCHIDVPWIPSDLFTSNASAEMKARMPYVTDGPDGPYWTCKNGGSFGLMNGVGPAGQKHQADRGHGRRAAHVGLGLPGRRRRVARGREES